MKVCDATQFYSAIGGGVKRYVSEKRKYVLERTEDEHILVVPGEETKIISEGRLTTCTIKSPRIGDEHSRYRVLLSLHKAHEMILSQKPDIIESGDPYHLGWKLLDVADRLEIPLVGFYHSHFPEAYMRTVLKYCGKWFRDVALAYAEDYIEHLYNRFDRTLIPSHFLADTLAGYGVMNTCYVHLGVDTDVFKRARRKPTLRPAGLDEDCKLLLYVGRLAGEKNVKTLAAAFRLLHKNQPGHFHLMVIGDGVQKNIIEQVQEETGQVSWMRFCEDKQKLADFYRAADIFVHPGVCETFGLVALESQACGCPVIGIRGSYMDANIFAGLEHWAGENTPQSLAEAIAAYALLDLKKMGRVASDAVRMRFSWNDVFDRVWNIYRSAIAEKKENLRHGG
ncbi:MAG: glycosyltransferase [Verrucomicrobiota bacterium]